MPPDLMNQIMRIIALRRSGQMQQGGRGAQPPAPYRPGLPGQPVAASQDGGTGTPPPNPFVPPDRLPGGGATA